MRFGLVRIRGGVEIASAGLLVALAAGLPGEADLVGGFEGARRVAAASGEQVRLARDRLAELRRSPLHRAADRLKGATQSLSAATKAGRVDFEAVAALRDAAGRAADGFEGLAKALDPEGLARLADGLGASADFLDRTVLPAASKAADELDAATRGGAEAADRLAEALAAAPPDLKPVRELYDGLARFDEGLGAVHGTLDPARLAALRKATDGAEGVVSEAGRLAARAAGYSYPVVTFDGLRPKVGTRPFWPRGAEVSADMRKVAGGVNELGKGLGALAEELPKVRAAVQESRRSVAATRKALGAALARQEEVERLLAEMPERAARLAEALPRMGADLSKALRAAGALDEVAGALRASGQALAAASADWARTKAGLTGPAALLRATESQLDLFLRHRRDYESARDRFEGLSEDFAAILPAFAEGVTTRLADEERALDEMARGLAQVESALPAQSRSLTRSLALARTLAWLGAALAAIHGGLLLASPQRVEGA